MHMHKHNACNVINGTLSRNNLFLNLKFEIKWRLVVFIVIVNMLASLKNHFLYAYMIYFFPDRIQTENPLLATIPLVFY